MSTVASFPTPSTLTTASPTPSSTATAAASVTTATNNNSHQHRSRIPSLYILCLRSIGPPACNPNKSFGGPADDDDTDDAYDAANHTTTNTTTANTSHCSSLLRSFHSQEYQTFLSRIPYGLAAGRPNANEVDLCHPFCAQRIRVTTSNTNNTNNTNTMLVLLNGNVALDLLQNYIDSMVELGRCQDARLGIGFWQEYHHHAALNNNLTSLSFHNASIGECTIQAMISTKVGPLLGTLDLTGSHTMTDTILNKLLPHCPNLQRLSLKSCRRLTNHSLQSIVNHCSSTITCLDIGGTYNMTTTFVVQHFIPNMNHQLNELYASGLGWTDTTLAQFISLKSHWKGLGLAFSALTTAGLKASLSTTTNTLYLTTLNIAFCEVACDSTVLGFLGRSLPHVTALDIRGNTQITTLTGWFDGRLQLQAEPQELFVLARYSGITKSSIEETQRIHPKQAAMLTCVIDASGTGGALH